MKYRVEHLQNNVYQVIDRADIESDFYERHILFQGTLSDCEAYIRLKQNDNVEF